MTWKNTLTPKERDADVPFTVSIRCWFWWAVQWLTWHIFDAAELMNIRARTRYTLALRDYFKIVYKDFERARRVE